MRNKLLIKVLHTILIIAMLNTLLPPLPSEAQPVRSDNLFTFRSGQPSTASLTGLRQAPQGDATHPAPSLDALSDPSSGFEEQSKQSAISQSISCIPETAIGNKIFLPIILKNSGSNGVASQQVIPAMAWPPDPRKVATDLDPTVPTDIFEATQFIYSGDNPIQVGMAKNTISAKCIAVVRGHILTRAGEPLAGARVSIANHPEYGFTLSRADGAFDLVVNGGSLLTVNYEKAGFIPIQRQIKPAWRDYALLDDVVMIPYDSQVTEIDLMKSGQTAQGSLVTDGDGTRQATLLFSPGTQARMTLPGGKTRAMDSTLHVRATEYTVGDNGPEAMPAELPANVGYTYAVELSVDEALAAGAMAVEFNQPVIFYIENFLNLPAGLPVPSGYYDREKGVWIPANNGQIIRIVSIGGGVAELDVNGDGTADDATALAKLGITAEEQKSLAGLYASDQSLWRVSITHFTPWDHNFPYAPPAGATAPNQPQPNASDKLDSKDCSICTGSTIEIENQILGEQIDVVGTPFSLHYASDRAPGRQTARQLTIPLSGDTIPADLKRIDLVVEIAGREFTFEFPAQPNQAHLFTWDGQDAYGRLLQGAQRVDVRIGYVYDGVYQAPGDFEQAFANFSGIPISGSRTRQEVTLWQEWRASIGGWNAQRQGLGGWHLNIHHLYDSEGRVLYRGDGARRSAAGLTIQGIETVAGNGTFVPTGEGVPAIETSLINPKDVAVGPDGSLYILAQNVVYRVGVDRLITRVAGKGNAGYSGDGGAALEASFFGPQGIDVGPDGSLYIADRFNEAVRRISPSGLITTVAGTGEAGYSGDGGLATQAQLDDPYDVTLGPDGSLYISDRGNSRIRRVGLDGIITTVAGDGVGSSNPVCSIIVPDCGDGKPATEAQIPTPGHIAVGPDGSLYITTNGPGRLRRVGADGIITSTATLAFVWQGQGIDFGPDGKLYTSYFWGAGGYIYQVNENGSLTVVAGDGTSGFSGDSGPAAQAQFKSPAGIDVGPDGSIYVADTNNGRIRRVGQVLPGYAANEITIPAEDGGEIYIFNGQGRHLRTLHPLTGASLYQFTYNNAGQLSQIIDGDGNTTTIERDGSGALTAIISPDNQRTTFNLDGNGYLASVTNPAGETTQLTYTPLGLLTSLTDPGGNVYQYTYDAVGHLVQDADPAGGSQTLIRTVNDKGYVVTQTTALSQSRGHRVEHLLSGDRRQIDTLPSGTQIERQIKTDGSLITMMPDGMVYNLLQGPDPRFGMRVPLIQSLIISTPNGLTTTLATSRTITLTDAEDPFSLSEQTNITFINGRPYTSRYDAGSRTFSHTTPEGRQNTMMIDSQGRTTAEQQANLDPINYGYDSRGRLTSVTQGQGPEVRTANFTYDANGYLSSITDPLGRVAHFSYDAAGRITQQTLADGRIIGYAYDTNSNLSSLTPPGQPSHTFSYNTINLPVAYTPPNVNGAGSNQTQYTYNADRQLTQITRPDGQTVDWAYDSAGRLTRLTLPRGSVTYDYNATTGSLEMITTPDGDTLTYTLDGTLLTGETWAGAVAGSVTYTYDNDFRIASQSINGGNMIAYQYDRDSLLLQAGDLTLNHHPQNGLLIASKLNSITDSRTYNGFAESVRYEAAYNGTSLYSVRYNRDKLGRINEKIETIGGTSSTHTYEYDLAGRLIEVRQNGTPTANYTYDSNGNRLTGPGGPGTYDDQDRLLQYGNTTYSYTANGERQSKTNAGQITTYDYDVLGNLIQVKLPGGAQIDYLIDGQNRRIGKRVNGTLSQGFLYQDSLNPVAELDGSNNIVARFVYGSQINIPDYMIKGGVAYRIIADHLGSPRLVVNASNGSIAQRLDYDEFGNVIQDTNPGFQPFGFAGGLYDRDTGLVRFGARDYDPQVGRWTTKDPILFEGGDTNLYGYVLGDPVNWVDPQGTCALATPICVLGVIEALKWLAAAGIIVTAAVGAGVAVEEIQRNRPSNPPYSYVIKVESICGYGGKPYKYTLMYVVFTSPTGNQFSLVPTVYGFIANTPNSSVVWHGPRSNLPPAYQPGLGAPPVAEVTVN